MSEIWYNNPKILLENFLEVLPINNISRGRKINSLARLAIYILLLIVIFRKRTEMFGVLIVLIIVSVFLGITENFTSKNVEIKKCKESTTNNPYMNFTFGDENIPICDDESKEKIRSNFENHVVPDKYNIWGKNTNDRNFYTLPNTNIVNDRMALGNWCYGNSGKCKMTGKDCLKVRDPTYHRGRITTMDYDFN